MMISSKQIVRMHARPMHCRRAAAPCSAPPSQPRCQPVHQRARVTNGFATVTPKRIGLTTRQPSDHARRMTPSAAHATSIWDPFLSWFSSIPGPEKLFAVVPTKLSVHSVTTIWDPSDLWIIPAAYVLVRPALLLVYIARRTVRDNEWGSWQGWETYMKGFKEESQIKFLETPLKTVVVPMAINYIISQILNIGFTYKMAQPALLKHLAVVSYSVNNFLYLAWLNLLLLYVKNKLFKQVMNVTTGGRRLLPAFDKLLTILICLLLALAALKVFGLQRESLGLAGVASVAVALGTQEILKQFLASLVLCNPESPLSVGDYVKIMGTQGTVTNIGWFATTIIGSSTTPTTFPNSDVLKAKVENLSLNKARRMVEEVDVIPPQGNPQDIFAAARELKQELRNSGHVDNRRSLRVHVYGFSGAGVTLRIECFFDAPGTARRPRDIELDGRMQVMEIAVRVLSRRGCQLGRYPPAVVGGAPGAATMLNDELSEDDDGNMKKYQ